MRGYWTLPQSLMWLISGRVDVDKNSSAFDVINNALRAGNEKRALAARDEVQARLADGRLVAYGLARNATEHTAIPPTSWLTLDTLHMHHGAIAADAVGVEGVVRYRDVQLKAKDVRSMWPARVAMARTTEQEARVFVTSKRDEKGTDLTSRELEALRAEKCADFPRDNFRKLARDIQGLKPLGRRPTAKNVRK